MDVRRPLHSVGKLVAKGCQLQLRPRSYLRYRGRVTPVVRQGNLYDLPVKGENTCVDDILVVQQH
eukprot:471971-Heterocapsa_arctica.AAC.1